MNPRRLALWASAIVRSTAGFLYRSSLTSHSYLRQHANDATKHEPPNAIEFDGVRDGRVVAVKPRGRSGPGAASTDNATSAMLIAAMVPLLTSLVDCNSVAVAAPSSGPSMSATAASSLKRPLSPASDIGNELNDCLRAFKDAKGINFMSHKDILLSLDLTPDILPDVPVTRLCQITGAVEGRIMKFQAFCKAWNARNDEKRADGF